tara:strand:- start:279 stop:659 length:381 start_codon:yes stop_codon:yes gene_type:complete
MLFKEAIKWASKKLKPKKPLTKDQLGKAIIGTSVVSSVPLSFLAQKVGQIQRDSTKPIKRPKTKKKSKSRKNKPEMYPPPKGKKSLTKKMKGIAEKIPTTPSYKKKKRNEKVVKGVGRNPTYRDRD